MCLPKGVYSKDDCGKLKREHSNHTRRSKQNTYHVANKNIAPSKIPMVVRRKRGMPLGACPSLVDCFSLNITLGCHGHPRAHALLTPYSFIHRDLTQNLKTSITQILTKPLVRSVSIINQITTLSTVANPFIFYYCIISTVLQLYHGLYPPTQTTESSK